MALIAVPRAQRSGLCWREIPGYVPFGVEAQTLSERFFQIAAAHPHRVAVDVNGSQDAPDSVALTYRELADQVERLAAAIRDRVPSGRSVALLFRHGARWPVAMLAALHAGRSYVPLEPAFPDERLRHVLQDSDAALLLTDGHRDLATTAESGARPTLPLINVEYLLGAPSEPPGQDHPPAAPPPARRPDDLAYVLYTSGSTGGPKGVMQSDRNVLHFIRSYSHNLRLVPEDRLLWVASAACDAAVMDIFGALLNGATLVPWRLREQGLAALPLALRQRGVTIYHSTPTVFRHLCEALGAPEALPNLRLVVMGGEPVLAADLERFRRHFPRGTGFVNGYGPTEATVVLQAFMDHDTALTHDAVPIGQPVGDIEVFIDPDGVPPALSQPPPGRPHDGSQLGPIIGEMVIRSPHVALGYLNRPEETARTFRGAPSSPERHYRTGDLGWLLPDGRVVHAGRRDALVKVRGQRIQLEEVERALERHPSVRHAGVKAFEHPHRGLELAAFVTPRDGRSLAAADVHNQLLRELPEHMVPATLTVLDVMPLTPSGKLDRHALPEPPIAAPATPPPAECPADGRGATPTEQALWRLFADVLGREDFGCDDSFFDLGGTSMQTLMLFVRVQRRMGRALPLAVLHHAATVRALAREIDCDDAPQASSPVVPIQQGRLPPVFMVHGRFGGTLFFRGASIHLGAEYSMIGLQPPSMAGVPWAHRSINAMATHYLAVMERDYALKDIQLAGVSFGGIVALEMARILEARGMRPRILIIYDTRFPGVPGPAADQPWRSRLRGVISRARRVPARLKYETAVRVARAWCWGKPTVPMRWRPLYVGYWCDRLARAHRPQSYGGDVLLVCTSARRTIVEAQWRAIITGKLTVEVRNARHEDLLGEQDARALADMLRPYLRGHGKDAVDGE